jgi:hypothetical protein
MKELLTKADELVSRGYNAFASLPPETLMIIGGLIIIVILTTIANESKWDSFETEKACRGCGC